MARSVVALFLLLAMVSLSTSCGRGKNTPDAATPGVSPAEVLRGHDVGVTSGNSPAILELRYVLTVKYGIGSSVRGGTDVLLVASAADSLGDQLRSGQLRYAVLPPLAAFQAQDDAGFRVLLPISNDMQELIGVPAPHSVLASYADVISQKPDAITELNRMLRDSLAYFGANRGPVLDAVAEEANADRAFLDWWWERFDMPLGQLPPDFQQGILSFWQAAVELGDIEGYPALTDVLFAGPTGTATSPAQGARQTVSLAVLADPSRRAALYAIENGLATSNLVDLNITYLPQAELTEAASTRQYDVVETTPTLIVQGRERGVGFMIISAGLVDLDGTQLYTYD
jgi:hypothetical protein